MDEPSLERQATRVRVTAWRAGVAEAARRPPRGRGAHGDPRRRPRPGPDRRRRHDAHPGSRGGPRGRVPAHRGPDRRPRRHRRRSRSRTRRRTPIPTTRSSSGWPGRWTRPSIASRNFVATASCGICGKASLDQVAGPLRPDPRRPRRGARRPCSRSRTGCARARPCSGRPAASTRPGLFDAGGDLLALREDVGRHNALDKLIGSRLLAGELPLHDRILLVSGRVSFELVQKAAVAGIPVLAAVSAPSDLAVEAAARLGVTLVGFLRGDGFNVYARPDRVAVGRVGSVRLGGLLPRVGRPGWRRRRPAWAISRQAEPAGSSCRASASQRPLLIGLGVRVRERRRDRQHRLLVAAGAEHRAGGSRRRPCCPAPGRPWRGSWSSRRGRR